MITKRIIPCLDVRDGRVVKGVRFRDHVDMGDILELAQRYRDSGADEIVFLDISASAEGRATLLDTVRRTAESLFIPLTVGGGIRAATVQARGDVVVLVGYMKKLGPRVLSRYEGRILNTHPALLPEFGIRVCAACREQRGRITPAHLAPLLRDLLRAPALGDVQVRARHEQRAVLGVALLGTQLLPRSQAHAEPSRDRSDEVRQEERERERQQHGRDRRQAAD